MLTLLLFCSLEIESSFFFCFLKTCSRGQQMTNNECENMKTEIFVRYEKEKRYFVKSLPSSISSSSCCNSLPKLDDTKVTICINSKFMLHLHKSHSTKICQSSITWIRSKHSEQYLAHSKSSTSVCYSYPSLLLLYYVMCYNVLFCAKYSNDK